MRRHIGFCALTVATVPLVGSALAQTKSTPGASSPSGSTSVSLAASVARRARNVASSTRTFEANFDQQDTVLVPKQVSTASGKLTFERAAVGAKHGDKIRWEYVPSGDLVVSDGTTVWSYFAAKSQAHARLPTGSYLPLVLAVLVGDVDLAKDFQLSISTAGSGALYVLVAKPNVATPAYDRLLIYFDASGFRCRRVVVLEATGNRHRFEFTHSQINSSVNPATFRWVPPPGVTIVP